MGVCVCFVAGQPCFLVWKGNQKEDQRHFGRVPFTGAQHRAVFQARKGLPHLLGTETFSYSNRPFSGHSRFAKIGHRLSVCSLANVMFKHTQKWETLGLLPLPPPPPPPLAQHLRLIEQAAKGTSPACPPRQKANPSTTRSRSVSKSSLGMVAPDSSTNQFITRGV